MSPENRAANAKAELVRAEEALRAAEALLALGLGRDAVSRAYYAAFHGACALLASLDHRPRTHRGVQRLLSTEVVRPGRLDAEHLRRFNRLQERRSIADYGVTDVPIDEASVLVADARAFVNAASSLIARGA